MKKVPKILYCYLAEYENSADLYNAAKKVRDAGFSNWDTHSPFPIHGMDKAMGLGRSKLSTLVLICGALGTLTAVCLQFYTQVFKYPTIVQGKPANINTIPAFFPVMFELTILFAAFGAFFGILIFNFLPRFNHPLFNSDEFTKFSDDGFFISIETRDVRFSREDTFKLLESTGAKNIYHVNDD